MADSNLALLSLLILPISFFLFLYFIVRPRPVKIPIKDRHVFITGGSSGIGLALAHLAASEGAKVSILARSAAKLEEAKQAIRAATGCDVAVYSVDVRDYDAVKKAVEEAAPIDVLVCNQGAYSARELENLDLEDVKFMLDVNLTGNFHLIKAALPGMKSRKNRGVPASIAIMSSQGGQVGIYGYTAYSASKFGLRGLAEALQQEVIAQNIYVSLIFPPETDTPLLNQEKGKRSELSALIAGTSGLMSPEEVAKKSMEGIKRGKFFVTCNFYGVVMSIITAGMSPQSSVLMALMQVMFAGLLRIPVLCFQWNWYTTIQKWHARNSEVEMV